MRWWPISPPSLRPRLERGWCRAHDLTAGRRNAQDGQTAFAWAVGTETKDPVDSRKTRRIGQNLLAEALRPLCFAGPPRQGIVSRGEARGPGGIFPKTGAVPSREAAEASRFGGH